MKQAIAVHLALARSLSSVPARAQSCISKADQSAKMQAAKDRNDALVERLQNEFELLKIHNRGQAAEDRSEYDRGLLSISQFYDRKRAMIKAESEAEIKAQEAVVAGLEEQKTLSELKVCAPHKKAPALAAKQKQAKQN